MGQAELDGPADDLLRNDEPVGLCHDATVKGPGLVVRRSAMVFGRLSDGLYLFRSEPLLQGLHSPDDASAFQMMGFPVHGQAQIVAGSGRVKHIPVHRIVRSQFQGPAHHGTGVVLLMHLVEGLILRYHLRLQELRQRGIYVQQAGR